MQTLDDGSGRLSSMPIARRIIVRLVLGWVAWSGGQPTISVWEAVP